MLDQRFPARALTFRSPTLPSPSFAIVPRANPSPFGAIESTTFGTSHPSATCLRPSAFEKGGMTFLTSRPTRFLTTREALAAIIAKHPAF